MDRLIPQLVQIEESAEQIIRQADLQKQKLSEEYQKKKTDYEKYMDAKTEETLQGLSGKLEQKRKQDVRKLHIATQEALVSLNTEYKQNGKQIAKQIVQRILEA